MEIGFLQVLLLALLPALGNVAGGLLNEFFPVSYRTLSLALHAATGILFAVIGVDLMPRHCKPILPRWYYRLTAGNDHAAQSRG